MKQKEIVEKIKKITKLTQSVIIREALDYYFQSKYPDLLEEPQKNLKF